MTQDERKQLQAVIDRLMHIASEAPAVAVYRKGIADLGYRPKVEAIARELKALVGETEPESQPN